MSKIRETVVSNAEKKFVTKCLNDHTRLDGRAFDEFRDLKIEFGKDWGSCHVSLGKTKVLAQVSCEVQVPKSTRPSEGILYINLELNPLAAPHFEAGRQSELSVQLNRLLEKCIKDSRTVDLESLCIKVNEKVWALRVDVNVLNYEGNILDCASVAALAALTHFRRPDVTCDGEEIIIHTYAQRDSIPTTIHHYPVCVSFAIFSNGEVILADPTLLEEGVADAFLTLGLNAYNELCGLHLGGSALMSPNLILKTTSKASRRARNIIQQIKDCVEEDTLKRQENKEVGFEFSEYFTKSLSRSELLSKCLENWIPEKKQTESKMEVEAVEAVVEPVGKETSVLMPPDGANNPWSISSEEEDSSGEEVQFIEKDEQNDVIEIGSDGSEEENVIVLNADNKTNKRKKKSKM